MQPVVQQGGEGTGIGVETAEHGDGGDVEVMGRVHQQRDEGGKKPGRKGEYI